MSWLSPRPPVSFLAYFPNSLPLTPQGLLQGVCVLSGSSRHLLILLANLIKITVPLLIQIINKTMPPGQTEQFSLLLRPPLSPMGTELRACHQPRWSHSALLLNPGPPAQASQPIHVKVRDAARLRLR